VSPEEIALLVKLRDEASSGVDQIKSKFGGLGDTIGKVGTIAGGFLAANVVQQGVGALTGFIGDSIGAIKESIAVNAQLDAVLKSTGGAVGLTADQIRDMASAYEKSSKFEDEAILNGQNLLLTFTNIGGDVFPRATETMLDMAQALGTDAAGSAVQLGKALNDPVAGISALSRVGVTFTDQQKEQIAAMVEAGNVAGAQTVILDELAKEFGGSAKAASDAAGSEEVYKDHMNDLQEQIGSKMLPIQMKLTEAKLAMVDLIATKVIPILEELYTKYWPSVQQAISDVTNFIIENWPKIQPIFEFAEEFVRTKIEGMIQYIQGVVQVVTGVIDLITALIHGDWAAAWDALEQIAEGSINILIGQIKYTLGNIPQIMLDLLVSIGDAGYQMGKKLADSIIDGIGDLASRVADKISIAGVSASDVAGFVTGPFRAKGGSVNPGQGYFVGEEGMEWFQPDQPGTIISNDNLGRIGGGTQVNVTLTGNVYGDREGAIQIGSQIGWETLIDLQRRGAA
jgi:phage-related protein